MYQQISNPRIQHSQHILAGIGAGGRDVLHQHHSEWSPVISEENSSEINPAEEVGPGGDQLGREGRTSDWA